MKYGLFKNGKTPENAMPYAIANADTWSEAVEYFVDGGFGGGEVYNLGTRDHVATVGGRNTAPIPKREGPAERRKRAVYATGNRWAIENFKATHS